MMTHNNDMERNYKQVRVTFNMEQDEIDPLVKDKRKKHKKKMSKK